jgi:phosphatidylglycerol:prolipoprotein diacylglycerol transferase
VPFPEFDPVLVQIGPLAIRWYALAYVAGILLGWRYTVALTRNLAIWRGRRITADDRQVDDLVLWITVGIIVGGRLGYVLFYNTALIWTDPVEILRTWNGGMSFHGGLIGVVLAMVGFAAANRIEFVRLGDLVAPCVPIGLFFGRIANFINGELWGRPTDAPWGIIFPRAGPEPRHPSQLYEALLEGLVLFLILRFATHGAKKLPRKGYVAGLFLSFYALFRIALERVRQPDVGMPDFPLGLTMGTMLSVPMLLLGLFLVFRARRDGAVAPVAPLEDGPEARDPVVPEAAIDPFPATAPEPEDPPGA